MLTICFFITFCILLVVFGYFLPSFIAFSRHKKNALPILLVNLFFGMTFVGWIVALIWALTYEGVDERSLSEI